MQNVFSRERRGLTDFGKFVREDFSFVAVSLDDLAINREGGWGDAEVVFKGL